MPLTNATRPVPANLRDFDARLVRYRTHILTNPAGTEQTPSTIRGGFVA
jgi:hypothetical protein